MTKLKLVGSRNGVSIQQSTGISAKRLATDPAFERTRENNAEFTRASKAAILFCDAFRMMMPPTSTKGAYVRLQSIFTKVLKADPVSARGERIVSNGNSEGLKNFRGNLNVRLSSTLLPAISIVSSIDRAAGALKLDIPAFTPSIHLKRPQSATHFRLTAGGAAIDFNTETISNGYASSEYMPFSAQPIAAFSLVVNVAAASVHPLFLALGLEFYELVNGVMVDVKTKSFNAMQVLAVSGKA